jgi:arsenate reductase-like glutaredoxin family protein
MNIQIFGTKKCKETAKAIRFFKERGIAAHFVNIAEKPMSRGELANVCRSVAAADLIDQQSRDYDKLGLKYLQHDPAEKILEHPLLMKTPVVRSGSSATVGFQPDTWNEWIKQDKK